MRRVLLATVVVALLYAAPAGAWTWPVDGPVLQPFVFDPGHPYAAGQHRGLDIGAAAGGPVLAPAAGTVTFAGTVPTSGKSLTIVTADGYAVTLTHLGSITVAEDTSVVDGQPVGAVGPSGEVEVPQPYVHLGVRVEAQPQGYLDPLQFLPAAPTSPPPAPASPGPVGQPVSSTPAASPVPAPPVTPAGGGRGVACAGDRRARRRAEPSSMPRRRPADRRREPSGPARLGGDRIRRRPCARAPRASTCDSVCVAGTRPCALGRADRYSGSAACAPCAARDAAPARGRARLGCPSRRTRRRPRALGA